MTTEQEFFKAFKLIECEKCIDKYCSLVGEINYPTQCTTKKHIKITPEIVLKLIAIWSAIMPIIFAFKRNVQEVIDQVLIICTNTMKTFEGDKEWLQEQVKELF